MKELDLFIPFAKAGQDGPLNIVRTAFVDVANLSLKNFHVHMNKVSWETVIMVTSPCIEYPGEPHLIWTFFDRFESESYLTISFRLKIKFAWSSFDIMVLV